MASTKGTREAHRPECRPAFFCTQMLCQAGLLGAFADSSKLVERSRFAPFGALSPGRAMEHTIKSSEMRLRKTGAGTTYFDPVASMWPVAPDDIDKLKPRRLYLRKLIRVPLGSTSPPKPGTLKDTSISGIISSPSP